MFLVAEPAGSSLSACLKSRSACSSSLRSMYTSARAFQAGAYPLVCRDRRVQLLQRDAELARLVVVHAQLGVYLGPLQCAGARALRRLTLLWLGRRGAAAGERQRYAQGQRGCRLHADASVRRRCVRRVRSCTCPASCPQAPSMSSPRVLRTVAISPACIRISWNRRTAAGEERSKPESGNGLKGIRLYLQGTWLAIVEELARVLGTIVHPCEHDVFERDEVARRARSLPFGSLPFRARLRRG